MRSQAVFYALVGAAAAWNIRADFSRCDTSSYEASLDGVNGTLSGTNIFDFTVTAPYSGALVLRSSNSVGNGSPYPVDQVYIDVFTSAGADGVFGNATFEPGLEVLPLSLVAWYTIPGLDAFSTAKINSSALAGDQSVSVKTIVNDSRLRVYYCGAPTSA